MGQMAGTLQMKIRRWLDQLLTESRDQKIALPWSRSQGKKTAGTRRENSQDAS